MIEVLDVIVRTYLIKKVFRLCFNNNVDSILFLYVMYRIFKCLVKWWIKFDIINLWHLLLYDTLTMKVTFHGCKAFAHYAFPKRPVRLASCSINYQPVTGSALQKVAINKLPTYHLIIQSPMTRNVTFTRNSNAKRFFARRNCIIKDLL